MKTGDIMVKKINYDDFEAGIMVFTLTWTAFHSV